jgi:hypothetical protein
MFSSPIYSHQYICAKLFNVTKQKIYWLGVRAQNLPSLYTRASDKFATMFVNMRDSLRCWCAKSDLYKNFNWMHLPSISSFWIGPSPSSSGIAECYDLSPGTSKSPALLVICTIGSSFTRSYRFPDSCLPLSMLAPPVWSGWLRWVRGCPCRSAGSNLAAKFRYAPVTYWSPPSTDSGPRALGIPEGI